MTQLTFKSSIILLLVLLSFRPEIARPQSSTLFGVGRELTSSLINYLYQDSYGMMWIATEEGLNCYDGNKFRQFRHTASDATSLCSNFVNALLENEAGELVVCTNRGMQIYNPATRRFSHRICNAAGREFAGSVVQAVRRANGDYWIVGDSVRVIRKPGNKGWEGLRMADPPTSCRGFQHVSCAASDASGNVWLSMRDKGVACVSSDNKVRNFFGKASDPTVVCMAIGNDGLLYLGTTAHGLLRFNADNSTFETLSPFTGKAIKSLYVDRDGRILQATDGTGIIAFDPNTAQSVPLQVGNGITSTANAKTHWVVRDNCDNLWIGLFQTGVMMLPDHANSFGYLGPHSERFNVIGRNCISSIFKDSGGVLWVGADNDGIYSLNSDLSTRSHFYNDAISVPMCIFEDSGHNLWVGTYLSGVGTMDRSTGRMSRVNLPDGSNICFAITEDRDRNVWLGMMNSGLIRYSLDTRQASMDFPWRDKVEKFIASLYYSGRTNSLYIGTYAGFQIVKDVSHNNASVSRLLSSLVVHSIDECEMGRVWLGTTDGLISYDPKTGQTVRYGVAEGLNSTTVYAVRCQGKSVWMSTNNGIARLELETKRIVTYYAADGLQGNEFYKNSVYRDGDGHLYFGGTEGITHFNPRDISSPGRQWTPRIIDIYAHGSPLECDSVAYTATRFNLRNGENSFSVEFGTKELIRSETVRFAYSIDGKSWETLPSGAYTVNFYDLDPGEHRLRFKALDGTTESTEKAVTLAIAYPWYSSPWAKLIYILIFVSLVWMTIQGYTTRMRNKAQLIELRHSDQLNEARIRSYVNISHEIRTPMSLIISPLKRLLATDTDSSRQQQYRLIMRNAKRVLRLIDELMDLRKIEKHQMTLTYRPTRLAPFIQDICDTFAQTVADKKQTLVFSWAEGDDIEADIDTTNFDKILMNLFSNAVKYTPVGGDIRVELHRDGKEAVISVTDTGIGIPPEDRERIFERFYRVKGNIYGGTGVGLHLAHQLALLHGGSLTVEPNPEGKGSTFILRVPLQQKENVVSTSVGISKNTHAEHLEQLKLPPLHTDETTRKVSGASRVLIVEDDQEICSYLASELSPYYKVDTCSNGRQALDLIFSNPPDIILSDVMMPEVDGLELARAVKHNINLNNIPVVLVSALARDEDNINAINAGADAYFTKPFNIDVVRERLAALLQRYRELEVRYSGQQIHDDHVEEVKVESADEKLIRRVVKTISDNLDDPELSVEKLASEVGLSRVHLHRKLKELTNQSPSDFIRNTRLRQAAHLLREKKISVAEAAFATGFNSASTFSIAFKRLFGVTPSAYANG